MLYDLRTRRGTGCLATLSLTSLLCRPAPELPRDERLHRLVRALGLRARLVAEPVRHVRELFQLGLAALQAVGSHEAERHGHRQVVVRRALQEQRRGQLYLLAAVEKYLQVAF